MDGYTAFGASITRDGYKQTMACPAPRAVVADVDILAEAPPAEVAGAPVQQVITTDGVKLRLGPSHWLMLRFSGTEPLLRLYCEAPSAERVAEVLAWARQYALEQA